MSRFFQKKNRSTLYSLPVLFGLILLIFFLGRAVWNAYSESVETKKQVARVQAEFNEVSSRVSTLSKDVASLKTEDGVEKEIRKRFSVAKDGEQVVIIVTDPPKDEEVPQNSEPGFFKNLIQSIRDFF